MPIKGRVIAGKYKSRQLLTLFDSHTRATKDRVKEAMFSALGNDLKNATVLDLFAGTGALGIEALSRGATKAIFCENSLKTLQILTKNLEIVEEEVILLKGDYENKLAQIEKNSLDIVFIDPPYDYDIEAIVSKVFESNILKKEYIMVLETDKEANLSLNNVKIRKYKYGLTHLTILRGAL
ncbi:MAG: 16S rRNA (guanine(966)-N(2))-methyltransferase RsmD [Bacilli bacterium]